MAVRIDRFPTTGRTISVPVALGAGALPTGLPAPAYRAFVMLASLANDGGYVNILKPELERLTGTRIDNANRFLEPIRDSLIDLPGLDDVAVGEPWFDEIDYVPEEQKRLAGVITAQLSPAGRSVQRSLRWPGNFPIAADEFRRLSTATGIIVYLRCRRIIAGVGKVSEIVERFDDETLFSVFGQYAKAAVSSKRNAAGDIVQTLSLSRMTEVLLEPGVADVRAHADDIILAIDVAKPGSGGRGRRWSHVDLVIAPRPKRRTLRELDAEMMKRQRHRAEIVASKSA